MTGIDWNDSLGTPRSINTTVPKQVKQIKRGITQI